MYLCDSGISFTSVWDFDILFWNSSDSALFFAFNHSIIIMCNIWLRIIWRSLLCPHRHDVVSPYVYVSLFWYPILCVIFINNYLLLILVIKYPYFVLTTFIFLKCSVETLSDLFFLCSPLTLSTMLYKVSTISSEL